MRRSSCGWRRRRGGYGLKEETYRARLPPFRGALGPVVAQSPLRVGDQGLICHQHERCQRGLSRLSRKQLILPAFPSLDFIALNVI